MTVVLTVTVAVVVVAVRDEEVIGVVMIDSLVMTVMSVMMLLMSIVVHDDV